jgi:glycosyltransferase involved in cell wall biosynthesis
MTEIASPLLVAQNDQVASELMIVACPPDKHAFISARLPSVKITFAPLTWLTGKSNFLKANKSVVILVLSRYLTKEANDWFKDSGISAVPYDILTFNNDNYLRLGDDSLCNTQFILDAEHLSQLQIELSKKQTRHSGSSLLKLPQANKTLFILQKKFADVSNQLNEYKDENPASTTVLINNSKNNTSDTAFDYAFTTKPGSIVVDSCTKVFAEKLEDLFFNPLKFETLSFVENLNSGQTLSDLPELSYNDFIELITKTLLPLSSKDLIESYSSLLPLHRNQKSEQLKNTNLSSPSDRREIDDEVLKYCSRPLARLINSYPRGNSVYLNTSHHGISNKDGFFTLKMKLGLKFAFYIHDLIPIDFPEYVRASGYSDHIKRMDTVSFCADMVIVNSEATKTSFLSWCESQELRLPECEVAYIGVEESFFESPAEEFSPALETLDQQSYFTYIGTIEPRKNHLFLLQIWRDWILRGITPPKLVIVGKRGWENQNVFNFIDQCEAIKPYVVELSDLSDAGLKRVIRGAKAMLFPSFSEGWGMPLIETQAMGTPVICSDIPVFHEASSALATFINPLDAITWQKTILDFSDPSKDVHDDAVKALGSYTPPRWEDHFIILDVLLDNLKSRAA